MKRLAFYLWLTADAILAGWEAVARWLRVQALRPQGAPR